MKVLVSTKGRVPRAPTVTTVRRAAEAMLGALELGESELSVLLCDDRTIHQLNKQYRKKDKATDVLAFALREGELGAAAGTLLGDVVLSLATATRQAKEAQHTVTKEVLTLLAHGILHLVGWDHRTDAEDRRMRKEVDRLVEAASPGNRMR